MPRSPYTPHPDSHNRTRSHRSIFKEEFGPDDSPPPSRAGPGIMVSSPTLREVRRLASDHDFVLGAHPSPRRLGWWPFVATHLSLPAALVAGIIFTVVAVAYTSTTTRQVLECPPWANGCPLADEWTVNNLGTIQGIIALVYLIGLFALAYVALRFCEAAVWPLLHQQAFTIRGLDAFLSTTRGSIISAPAAIAVVKTPATAFVFASAVIATLLPLAGVPLVGHAFTPSPQPVTFDSNYTAAAGISELYTQTNPPASVLVRMLAAYDSWATDLASEPLPAYRDWYIDRETLNQRGDFAAKAMRLSTSVSCSAHPIQQVERNGMRANVFATNITRATDGDSSATAEVWVRPQPQLTLWMDNFTFVSPQQTRATLMFAALDGTIESGAWTPLILGGLKGASSVACNIDVSASDDTLVIGNNPIPEGLSEPILSSLASLRLSQSVNESTRLNELLLWFASAPLLAGASVEGMQPMFFNSTVTQRAVAYTDRLSPRPDNTWTLDGIDLFVRLAVGALAQATMTDDVSVQTVLSSTAETRKLVTARALLLVIPPVLLVALAIAVSLYDTLAHRAMGIPVMRLAGLGELLKSSQTAWLREQAATDAAKAYLPNELGSLRMRYGVDKEGLAGLVEPAAWIGFASGGEDIEGGTSRENSG